MISLFLLISLSFFSKNLYGQCPVTSDLSEVCDQTTVRATANGGQWTTTSNAHIDNPNARNTVVEFLDFGPNTFVWTNGAGTCSDSIVVYGIKMPVDAGPNQPQACNTAILNGSNPSPGTGLWESLSGSITFDDITSPTAAISDLPIGDVTLVWHVTYKGCENTDTIVVTNNTPWPVNAGADDETCRGDSIQLDGSAPTGSNEGEWIVLGGSGIFTDQTLYNTWVTGLDPDNVNVYRWRVYNDNCEASDTVMITNNSIHLQDFTSTDTVCTDIGNISVTCPGVNNYDSGVWKVIASSGTVTNPNNCASSVTGLNFGANTFRFVATKGGCSDSIEVTIYAYPVIATANADVAVDCDDSVNLYGNDPTVFGGTGVWTVSNGSGTINNINTPTTFATGLNGNLTNSFTWTVSLGACQASDTVDVEYDEPEDAVISNPDTGYSCNNSYVLNAVAPTYSSGHWTSNTGGVTFTPNNLSASVTVDNLALGNNIFVWHVENGACPAKTDTILIINQFPPNVDAGGPYDTVCNNECINLSATLPPAGGIGTWSAPAPITFDDINLNTAEACNFVFGENILTWTVQVDQCSTSDIVSVFSDQADPAIAQADFNVCGNTTTISALPITNGTGEWTSNDPLINILTPNVNITDVTNLSNGGNTFYWTVTNGACSDVDTLIVYNDSVSIAVANPDQYICTDSAQLMANTPTLGSARWIMFSGGSTIVNDTKPDTWVTNLARGENVFIWRIENTPTCFSEDTIRIFNLSVDAYINQAEPLLTCTDEATIFGNPAVGQDITDYPAWGYWNAPANIATFLDESYFTTVVSNLPIDTTLLVWTVKNDYCSDHDTLTVVNNSPSQADAGLDTVVCSTELHTLHGNDPIRGTGFWRLVAGGAIITNSTLHNTSVTDLDYNCSEFTPDWWNTVNVSNEFEWVITYNGCESTDRVRILNGLPRDPDAGLDKTVCDNTVDLDAFDEGSCAQEHWWEAIPPDGVVFYDPEDGAVDNTDFNAIAEPIQGDLPVNGGSMTQFVWHKMNEFVLWDGSILQCELTDTVEITAYDLIEDVFAGAHDAICEDDYTLNGTSPDDIFNNPPPTYTVTGEWSVIFGDEANSFFDDSTVHNTDVHNLFPDLNILRWTIYNTTLGCEMSDDVYIYSARPSNADAGADRITCDDFEVLSQNIPARATDGYWSILTGGGTIVSHTCSGNFCNTRVEGLTYGENALLWTVENEYTGGYGGYDPGNPLVCTLTDTMKIFYYGVTANAGADIYNCADTARLTAVDTFPGTIGQWVGATGIFDDSGLPTSTLFDDVVRGLTTGRNVFTWTLSNAHCSDSDDLVVWNLLPQTPSANIDQVICDDSTSLNANDVTDYWNFINLNNGDTLQEGTMWGYWSDWPLGLTTIVDNTLTTTSVTGVPVQTEVFYIWNSVHDFTDYEINFTKQCVLTDTMSVFNNSVTAEAGSDGFVCGIEGIGAEYQLGATQVNNPLTGFWTPVINPGPSTIITPSAFDTWVEDMQNGDHIYQWTVSSTYHGQTCSASDQVVVEVRIPTTSTVAIPDSFEVCVDTVNLQANNPTWGNGHWEDVYGGMGTILDITANPATVKPLWPGKSKWAWVIDNDGCISSDTITVINNTVYSDADERVDPNIQNICIDTMNLSATDPNIFTIAPYSGTGIWTAVPGGITFDQSTLYNTTAHGLSNTQPNILKWTVRKGTNCVATSEVIINNNEFITDADVTSVDNHMYTCEDSITLAGLAPPAGGTGMWNLFSGGGFVEMPSSNTSHVSSLAANDTYLEWTVDWRGCSAKDTVVVTNNMVTAQAGVNDTVCYDTTSLAAGPPLGLATGQWTTLFGGGTVQIPSMYNSHVFGMATDQNQFIWTITKGVCTAKDTVTIWNNAPDPAVVESDKEVCLTTASLTVTAPPVNGSGIWSLLNGGGDIVNSTSTNASVENLQPGFNTFLWTVTKGDCNDIDTLNITNNRVVADAGLDDTICFDAGQLFGVDPSTFAPGLGVGTWTEEGGGGTVDNSTLNNTTVSDLGFGQNRFRWTVIQGGCSDTDDALLYNYEVVALASDIDECDFPVILTGNNPVANNGLWKNIGGLGSVNNSTLYNSPYSGLNIGLTNTLRWIVASAEYDQCADSVDISVTNSNFSLSAGPPQTLCVDTTVLAGDDPSPGNGYWTISAGAGVFINSTSASTIVHGLGQGNNVFQWNVTKGGCSNSNTVTIRNNTPSAANILVLDSTEKCIDTVLLNAYIANPLHADNYYWYQISGGGMTANSSAFIITVRDLNPGNNTFIWRMENGDCFDEDTVTIVNNMVLADAGLPDTVCYDYTNLNATDPSLVFPNQGSGYWTNLSGPQSDIVNSTSINTQVINLANGTSSFQWNVSLGQNCTSTDIVQITNAGIEAIAYDVSECAFPINLNAIDPSTSGGRGEWTNLGGLGSVNNSTLYNSLYDGLAYGSSNTLRWTVYNQYNECPDYEDIIVTNNNFTVSAGIPQTLCIDTAVLTADSPLPGTGYWTILSGAGAFDNSTLETSIVRNLGTGSNVLEWHVLKNGCSNSNTVTIINNSIVASTSADQLNLCIDTAVISGYDIAADGGYGTWELISGGGYPTNSTNHITSVYDLSRNENTFRWTIHNNGCSDFADVIVKNNLFDVEAGLPTTVCADSAQLDGQIVNGGNGVWTPQGGTPGVVAIPTLNSSWVHGLQQGTNTFRWSVTRDGCEVFDDVILTNDLPNLPQLISTDDVICIDSIQLRAIAPELGVTGKWTYTGSGGTILAPNSNDTWAVDINPGTTVFIWTVTKNDCDLSDQFTISNDAITANAGSPQNSLCQNYTSLNSVMPLSADSVWWSKADAQPGLIETSNSNVTDVTNLGYGQNLFVWNVVKGICDATDTVIVRNNSASPAEVGNVLPSCDGQANLNATSPLFGDGVWDYIGGALTPPTISTPSSSNTFVSGLEYGANLFSWTVTNTTAYATCTSDTIFTVVNNEFNITAGNNQILCDTISYLEGETRPNADSSYWWIITGSPQIDDSTDPNSQIILGQGQSTVLQWFVFENGCEDNAYVSVNNDGVTAIAYADEVCDPTATLNAVPPTSSNSGYWTTSTPMVTYSPDNSANNAFVSGLKPGANLFTWHLNSDNCSDSTTVNVNYLVPYVDAGPSVPICENEHTLSANDPSLYGGEGVWTVVLGSGNFANSTAYNSDVTGLDIGDNTFRWTVSFRGCNNSSDVTITNNKPVITVGTTQNICQSNTVLTGNNPGLDSALWTKVTLGSHTIVTPSLYNSHVTGMDAGGTYVFEWTVWNDYCEASEQLYVNNNSIIADAGTDIPICKDSTMLGASLPPNTTGEWSTTALGVSIQDSTLYNTWVHNLNATNNVFTWTISNGACSHSDQVTVTNNEVIVDAGPQDDICENSTTLFGSLAGGGVGEWNVVSGSGLFDQSSSNVTIVNDIGTGANVFSWTVTRGSCSNTDEVIINNNQVYADAGAGNNALCATDFELNAFPPALNLDGYWEVTGGSGFILNSTNYHTTVSNLARGENILRWTVYSAMCSSSDIVVIKNVTPTQAVTAPNREICADATTITANTPAYGTGTWQLVSGPISIDILDPASNSTAVENLGLGLNSFAWIITDNDYDCSTYDTIEIVNNSVVAFAGFDTSVCVDTFQLQASLPDTNTTTGLWTKISPYGNFDDPTVNNTFIRDMAKGVNTYRWTVYRNNSICSNSDEVRITNNTPTTADAGDDQISCDGTALLIGTTPDIDEGGFWSRVSGSGTFSNSTLYWTGVNGLSGGANRFTWSIVKGDCVSEDEIIVTNNSIFVYAGEPREVCTDSVFLTANEPTIGDGEWQLAGGAGYIHNSTNYQTAVTGLAPGVNTFKWTISEPTGCSDFAEVQITNNEPTDAIACDDTVGICEDYLNLCANFPPDGEDGYWTLLSGSGVINNSAQTNTLVTDLTPNSKFIWTIQKGTCKKYDTLFIENGSVDAIVSTDTMAFCDTIGTLSANDPLLGFGTWSLISGTGNIDNSTNYITEVTGLSVGNNSFRWTVLEGTCSATDDMVLVNNKFPVNANLATNDTICTPQAWVVGNSPSAGAHGFWTMSSGSGEFEDSTSPATLAFNIGGGTNTARWTIEKDGCQNYDEFLIVNETVITGANSPVIVCSDEDVAELVANDPGLGTGVWELISGTVSIDNSTAFSTTVTDVAYGSNSLRWTVTYGSCTDDVYVDVRNNFFTITAGNDRTVCDTTTILNGSNPGVGASGLWTIGGGEGSFDNSTAYNTRVNGLRQGLNIFTWTVTSGECSASESVNITNGIPDAIGGGDAFTCVDSFQFGASTPILGDGSWSLTGGSGNIVNPTLINSWVTDLGGGQNTFRWTVTNGQCQSYDDITISNNTVNITAGEDQIVCETSAYLAATPPAANGSGAWTVYGGGGDFSDQTLFNSQVANLHDGVNTFQWEVTQNGCSGSDLVVINNQNITNVYAGPDQLVFSPNTTLNANSILETTGTWSISGGSGNFADLNDAGTYVDDLQYGVNTFTWTIVHNTTGCAGSDNVDITYNGFEPEAGPTQYICADTAVLAADDVIDATTNWTIVQGFCQFENVTEPNTPIYNIDPGQNILQWNVSKNGFTTYDTVSVYNYMFTVDAGDDQHLCDDSTVLSGSGPLNTVWQDNWSGQWIFLSGGGTPDNQFAQTTQVNNLAPDSSLVQWVVTRDADTYPGTGACRASDQLNIVYHYIPQPDFITAPLSAAGCSPLVVSFINTTPTADTVAGTLYYFNYGNIQHVVDYDSVDTHTFYNSSDSSVAVHTVLLAAKITIPSGQICADTVWHDVLVYPVVNAGLSPSPRVTEYPHSTISIQNTSTDTLTHNYSWTWGDGDGQVDDFYNTSLAHTYGTWGDYMITLEVTNDFGCSDIDSQLIRILAPVPTSGGDNTASYCPPEYVQLYANVNFDTPGESEYKWIVSKDVLSNVIDTLHTRDPRYYFTEEGVYYFDFLVTGAGTDPPFEVFIPIRRDTITIFPEPIASFYFNPDTVMAPNQPIHCYNTSINADTCFWNFGLPNAVSHEREPMYYYQEEGDYIISLTIRTDKGCQSSVNSELPVVVLDGGEINFPNAFVPGDNSPNPIFLPAFSEGVDEYELQIYNRWGEFIWSTTNINEGWDGTVNGKLVPQDVYVYKYRVVYENGVIESDAGSVTLLR